jgi:hypothetical protein
MQATRSRFWLALRVSVFGLLALTAGLFLGKAEEVNRSVLLLFSGLSAVALWTERALVLGWLRHSGRRERWSRVALVVGTGERARGLVTALMRYPEAGWVVRGCLSMDPADPTPTVLDAPVIGSLGDLPELLQGDLVVDEVFFAVPPERLEMLTDALDDNDTIERALGIGAGLAWRNAVDMSRGGGTRVLPIFYIDLGWSSGMLQAKSRYDEERILYRERKLPANDPFFDAHVFDAHVERCPYCGGTDIEFTIEDRCGEKRAHVECLACKSRGPGVTRSAAGTDDWDRVEPLAMALWVRRAP